MQQRARDRRAVPRTPPEPARGRGPIGRFWHALGPGVVVGATTVAMFAAAAGLFLLGWSWASVRPLSR